MIIFDEKAYAENIIKNGYKNKKYINFDNIILVKYWKHIGLNKDQIKTKLQNFMSEFQELYNNGIMEYKVDRAMLVGMKFELLVDVEIEISQSEIDQIKTLGAPELQLMMFVLLVCWKFKGQPKRFRLSNTDVMRLCGIKMGYNTFWDNVYKITQSKMLSMVEYRNKSYYKIDIIQDEICVLRIKDYDDLFDYYLSLVAPDKYGKCECGKPFRISSNRHKYCKKCWKNAERKLWRENKRKNKKIPSLENPQNH